MCMASDGDRKMLNEWINRLQDENPHLARLTVIFNLFDKKGDGQETQVHHIGEGTQMLGSWWWLICIDAYLYCVNIIYACTKLNCENCFLSLFDKKCNSQETKVCHNYRGGNQTIGSWWLLICIEAWYTELNRQSCFFSLFKKTGDGQETQVHHMERQQRCLKIHDDYFVWLP